MPGTDGVGPDTSTGPPVDSAAPLSWVQADAGYIHSCGLLSDGRVVCWGYDDCVDAAPPPTERFVQISEGNAGGCHLREDGTISCMCCLAGEERQAVCDKVPPGTFIEVQVGDHFACALDFSRQLHCWGDLWFDVPIDPLLDFSMDIEGGCGVREVDGQIVCWGDQLWAEGEEPPTGLKYRRVTPGRTHACALAMDDNIYCWGHSGINWPSTPFPDPPPGPYIGLETFNQVSCGIRPDQTVECWYDFPQLNDVDDIPPEADGGPRWEPPPGEQFAQVGLGEWDACGVTLDGRALCWMPQGDTEGEVSELPSLDDL